MKTHGMLDKARHIGVVRVNLATFRSKEKAMNTAELKHLLIHRISEIEDRAFLQAIKTILDSKADQEVITLNKEQVADIMASKQEIGAGLFVSQEDLDIEVKAWLNGK